MRPILLIAKNFAREQRWPLFFLLLWVLGWATFGVFADPRSGPEDALMIFRQLAVYSVTFGVFFGSSAIQADQRSRRILGVLSKGISRRQYIFGLLAGIALVLGVFCLCMGFTASWLLGRFGFSEGAMWFGMLALWTACMLTAAAVVYLRDGPVRFAAVFFGDVYIFLDILPKMAAGCLIGVFSTLLIPREVVARLVGAESGFTGLVIATFAGVVMPATSSRQFLQSAADEIGGVRPQHAHIPPGPFFACADESRLQGMTLVRQFCDGRAQLRGQFVGDGPAEQFLLVGEQQV